MTIKYHEYGRGYEYGDDHKLTNNWNPDANYGNEYVNVGFNIDTQSYDGISFKNEADRELWHTEVDDLIESFDFLNDCGFLASRGNKREYLYPHPQQISGVILKNNVGKVAEAISKMKTSSIRWVDLHRTVYDISDDEYKTYLLSRKDDILKEIFRLCKTNRTNQYRNACFVCDYVFNKFKIERLGGDGLVNSSYIVGMVNMMIDDGFIVVGKKDDDLMFVRSINKTEQKKMKIKIPDEWR